MKLNRFNINVGKVEAEFLYADFQWQPNPLHNPDMIVVHHTGNRIKSVEDVYTLGIERFGQPSYHYVIDQNGKIYQMLHLTVAGAHAKNYNSRSFGIALLNLMPLKPPTLAMRYSLSQVIRFLRMHYHSLKLVTHFQLLLNDVNITARRCGIEFPVLSEEYYIKQGFRDLTMLSVESFKVGLLTRLKDLDANKLSKEMLSLSIKRIKNCPGHFSHVLF